MFKTRDIQSTKQYAELQRLMGKTRDDKTPSRSLNQVSKQESIASLKNSMKIRIRAVDNSLKNEEKDINFNELRPNIQSITKKISDKIPSSNPSFVNTETTARRKSQVYIVEQPEMTDRSRGQSTDPNFQFHKKAISMDRSTPTNKQIVKKGDKMEDNSVFSITSDSKLEKKKVGR